MKSERLAGKRALITAAGQGIGRASAIAMADAGAHVVATDISEDALNELAATNHVNIETRLADARDTESIKAAVDHAQPDVLFNCAGFVHHGTVLDATDEEWDFAFDLNVKSMFRTIQAALPGMLERGNGSIINMASACSPITGPGIMSSSLRTIPRRLNIAMVFLTCSVVTHAGFILFPPFIVQ